MCAATRAIWHELRESETEIHQATRMPGLADKNLGRMLHQVSFLLCALLGRDQGEPERAANF
eukprot:7450586-Prorocentrum_lima.AAC.1